MNGMFSSQDSSLKFWDTRSGNSPSNEIKLPGKVASLDVSKNGCYVLACSRDNSIHLFDVRMGGGARNGPVSTFTADGFQVSTRHVRSSYHSMTVSNYYFFLRPLQKS